MPGQMQLKEIDKLILQDIKEHSGSSQEQVINRLLVHYRSRTYIRTNIKRLVAIGLIRDEREGRKASLKCS